MRSLVLLLSLGACDDALLGVPKNTGETGTRPTTGTAAGWCAVQATFARDCFACHSASAKLGGLDLETDPLATLVNQPSFGFSGTLVAPGDPAGSLLYLKVAGQQASDQGGAMPPTAGLDAPGVEGIRSWIADGASGVCATLPTGTPAAYHPEGYAAAAVHGLEAKLQIQVCTDCHGADLTGGAIQRSCDTCHFEATNDWRTDCTFCHGGTEGDTTGAPPENIDDSLLPVVFDPHRIHVNTDLSQSSDCIECHQKPQNVLSAEHLFVEDTTPGKAEVSFLGVSVGGTWDGAGSCTLYCHGDGQTSGTVAVGSGPKGCDDCHASITSSVASWTAMSGRHRAHLEDVGAVCSDCHPTTVDNLTISNAALHIDGTADVTVTGGTVVWNGATCSGLCHTKDHDACSWTNCP